MCTRLLRLNGSMHYGLHSSHGSQCSPKALALKIAS